MNIAMDVYDTNMLFYGGITKPRKSGSMGKFELWVLLLLPRTNANDAVLLNRTTD